jgi:hypothetical protein
VFCLALARRVCDAWLSNKGVTRRAWRPFWTFPQPADAMLRLLEE